MFVCKMYANQKTYKTFIYFPIRSYTATANTCICPCDVFCATKYFEIEPTSMPSTGQEQSWPI